MIHPGLPVPVSATRILGQLVATDCAVGFRSANEDFNRLADGTVHDW